MSPAYACLSGSVRLHQEAHAGAGSLSMGAHKAPTGRHVKCNVRGAACCDWYGLLYRYVDSVLAGTLAMLTMALQYVLQSPQLEAAIHLSSSSPATTTVPRPFSGSISGTDKATNNTSRGFSIKQLKFDQQGQKLIESRVNRQMTPEEQKMLLRPGVK